VERYSRFFEMELVGWESDSATCPKETTRRQKDATSDVKSRKCI